MGETLRVVRPIVSVLILVRGARAIVEAGAIDEPHGDTGVRHARLDEATFLQAQFLRQRWDFRFVHGGGKRLWVSGQDELHIDPELG